MSKMKDIQLVDITVTRSGIGNPSGLDIQGETIGFNYGFDFGISRINKLCRIVFDCSIEAKRDLAGTEVVTGCFEIVYLFRLKDIHFSKPAKGMTPDVLNFETALAMANLVYATSRGIIYTRCEAMGISRAILPILFTADLRKNLRQMADE